jgi:hypothetical protein
MSAHDFDAIRAQYPLRDIAARYTDLKRQGREYVGCCIFHRDSDPSLTIYKGRDGHERWRCFPCGEGGDVIDFIARAENVDASEAIRRLQGDQMPMPNTRPPRELPPDESDCWEPILPVPDDAPGYDARRTFNPKKGAFVNYARATLITRYCNERGEHLGHIVRLEFDDGRKLCPVITYCAGPNGARRWCAKRMKAPYPLVGVEGLRERPDAAVMLVEGEKKREAGAQALPGFVWVSLLGGAEAVSRNDLRPLLTRNVTLWPDADVVGRRAMHEVGKWIEKHREMGDG